MQWHPRTGQSRCISPVCLVDVDVRLLSVSTFDQNFHDVVGAQWYKLLSTHPISTHAVHFRDEKESDNPVHLVMWSAQRWWEAHPLLSFFRGAKLQSTLNSKSWTSIDQLQELEPKDKGWDLHRSGCPWECICSQTSWDHRLPVMNETLMPDL